MGERGGRGQGKLLGVLEECFVRVGGVIGYTLMGGGRDCRWDTR